MAAQGVGPEDFCFTIHHFIGARACAFSYSKPGVSKVRIDATWGGPDSLLCYPHDTFQVDTRDLRITTKKIRCKTHYLDMDEDGTWQEVRSGEPWDWRPSLSNTELMQISDSGCKVANHLNTPIEIMYFVGVATASGGTICLPWFCTDKAISNVDRITNIRYAGRRVTVTTLEDIPSIESDFHTRRLKRPFSIRLRPRASLLRSEELLNEVARVAKKADVPVELEGSILSHSYYVLLRLGVKVASVDAFKEPTTRRRFGKLVRDKIPLRIEAHGERPRTLNVTSKELLHLLKAKAIEEAFELFWEFDQSRILEELTDLLEVVESIARVCETSLEQLVDAAAGKREERGGFESGVVLLETQSVPLITHESKQEGLFNSISGGINQSEVPKSGNVDQYLGSRRPKVEGDGITLSLIPPDLISGEMDVVLPLTDGVHEVKIHYSGCKLRVIFRSRTMRRDDPRQLILPFDDE